MKQVVINFSELNDQAKKKYLQFLVDNNIQIKDENQTVQLKLPKTSMAQQHRARQYSTLSELNNCRAFTPASKKNINIGKETQKQVVKTEHSIGPKFADLIETYPQIMKKIQNQGLLSRPLKWTLNELLNQIEELYSTKFAEDSTLIQKNVTLSNKSFQDFVYEFLLKKLKKQFRDQQIINFLSTVDLYTQKRRDVGIFQSFIRIQKQELLTFYLFTRAVIQKELKVQFYHPLRKKALDQCLMKLTNKQVQQIIGIIFGSQNYLNEFKRQYVNGSITISEFLNQSLIVYETQHTQLKQSQYREQPSSIKQQQQSCEEDSDNEDDYESDLQDYDNLLKKIQSHKDLIFSQQQNITPPLFNTDNSISYTNHNNNINNSNNMTNLTDHIENHLIYPDDNENDDEDDTSIIRFKFHHMEPPINEIQRALNSKLEDKITDFLEDMLSEIEDLNKSQKKECFQGIQQQIQDTVSSLLNSIYKYDKLIWFKKSNVQPDQQSLVYIENLQKKYRQMTKVNVNDDDEIEQFCLQLMQTPNLAKQIGNELLNYFQQYNLQML